MAPERRLDFSPIPSIHPLFRRYPLAATVKSGVNVGGITEPLVWIGTADGYNATGHVMSGSAYESSWYMTEDFFATGSRGTIRGNVPLLRIVGLVLPGFCWISCLPVKTSTCARCFRESMIARFDDHT